MATLMPNPLFCSFLTTELVHASATFQPRPKTLFDPSPPPARSRRSEGSSTDTTPTPDADGFIETDLRAGGPKLCESPCETIRKLPTNMKNHDRFRGPGSYQLKTKISDICRDDNVRPDYMEFCGRRSMYEPDCIPIVTLVVVTKRDYPSQTSWTIVSRKLFHYLQGSGITDVSVEIIDEDFEEDPQIHACVPSDAIFPIWKQVAMEIFHNIDCRGVFTIGCFRIGDENDRLKCPPTILMGVDRSVKRDWKPARDTIVAILDKRGLIDVAVTIHKDNKVARRRGISDREGFAAEDCRKDPNFGTSLSPWDRKDEQGTLGGWVEVQNPENGAWSTFALTCAHCCFPRESAVSPEDRQVVRHWTQQGVRVYDEHKKRLLPIDSPSYRDIRTELDVLANQIEGFESMEQYRRVEELRANDEFVIPSWERDWKNISAAITRRQKECHTIKKFLHDNENGSRLGTVFAASGLREEISTADPKSLSIRDWALVRVDARRAAGKNIFKSLPKSRVADISKLSEFGSRLPALDEELFKTGRATGHTNATYGNLAICHIATKTVNGKEEYVPTWEYVLLSVRGGDQDPIVDSGDSGSLVFDSIGVVLGMIFGGNGQCNLGYFTATRDLLSDIKHITGVQEIRIQDGIN